MNDFILLVTAGMAFIVTAFIGKWLIPFLGKLRFGQTINDVGPIWHKDKQGTPTMGGFMFIIGIVAAVIAGFISMGEGLNESAGGRAKLFSGLLMAGAYAFIGFIDDYIKVAKKRNLGLTALQKTIMQFLIAAVYLLCLYLGGDRSTIVIFPFIGQADLGFFYYPLAAIGIYFIVNAVNLNDGIDGLCSSVTFFAAVGLIIISAILQNGHMSLLAAALAGGTLGFLVWNFHPAKVFMGDTGAMFLGGVLVAICFGLGMPLLIIFVGIAYIIDAMSVILQIASVKIRKKRLFKMSPIHHSFEISGYSEGKVVAIFSVITLAGCALAVFSVLAG